MKFVVIFATLVAVNGLIGPCKQKELGETCTSDYECGAGTLTQCGANRKCQCGDGFQEKIVSPRDGEEGESKRICEPAPGNEGASCTTACQSPLLCGSANTCECVNPTSRDNGRCVVECPAGQELRPIVCKRAAKLNQECRSSEDCIDPFTECRGSRCRCQAGTTGSKCTPRCADGKTVPSQSCRLNYASFPLIIAASDKTDTCPNGQYCASWGNPLLGRCCPLSCPYGNAISGKTCRRGASGNSRCGSDGTSFCYAIEGLGQRNALCCPKPCKEPLPYYFNGKCYSKSFRDGSCEITAQCLGGNSMDCRDSKCECKTGFVADDSGKFPTCTKDCSTGTVGVGDRCLPVRNTVGDSCASSAQCKGAGLTCRQGTCQCPCGSTFLSTGGCQRNTGGGDLLSTFRNFLQG